MNFEYQTPGWKAAGTEPTELKENGWQANQKPPASIFNWFWTRVSDCISELQTKMSDLQDNIAGQLNGKTNVGHQHAVSDVANLSETIAALQTDIDVNANAIESIGSGWSEVSLSDFADMVRLSGTGTGTGDGDQWTASIWYNAALKIVKAHFNFAQILAEHNTGDVIGTIKTAYLPKFTQYGRAIIYSSNKEILRPAVVAADGALSIGKAYDSAMPEVIDNLCFLDIAYVTA